MRLSITPSGEAPLKEYLFKALVCQLAAAASQPGSNEIEKVKPKPTTVHVFLLCFQLSPYRVHILAFFSCAFISCFDFNTFSKTLCMYIFYGQKCTSLRDFTWMSFFFSKKCQIIIFFGVQSAPHSFVNPRRTSHQDFSLLNDINLVVGVEIVNFD